MSSRSACCRRPASPISREASKPTAAWCSPPPTTPSRTTASRSSPPRAPSFPTAGRTRSRLAWPARTGAEAHGRLGRAPRPLRPGRGRLHRPRAPDLPLRPGRPHGGARLRPRRDLSRRAPALPRARRAGRRPRRAGPTASTSTDKSRRAPSRAAPAPRAGRGRGPGAGLRRRRRPADRRGRDGRGPRRRLCPRHLRPAPGGRTAGSRPATVVVTTVMANLGLDKALAAGGHPHGQDPGGRPLRARGDGRGWAPTSAASSPGTSSSSTTRPRATASSRRSSSWR